jgi:hypothetical protein
MICTNLRFLFASTLALSLTTACTPREETTKGSATADESSGTTDEPTAGQTVTTVPTTTDDTAGTASMSGTGTTDGPTTTISTSVTEGSTTMGMCNDTPNQPINSSCTDPTGCGCDTEKCFVVPALGGFCGECLEDADCTEKTGGGCSVPNPIAGIGATCNMGGAGDGCMSDDVCVDPANGTCGVLLQVPGIITVATCGQCEVNADCTDPALANCTPTYIVEDFKGKLDCVADNSVENNFGCSLEDVMGDPAGNKACKSGFCGEASVMGLLKLGICGECNSDADCNGGTCTDPQVDLDNGTLIGSVCM